MLHFQNFTCSQFSIFSISIRAPQGGGVSRSAGLSQNPKRRFDPPNLAFLLLIWATFFQKTAKIFENGAFGAVFQFFLQVWDPPSGGWLPPPWVALMRTSCLLIYNDMLFWNVISWFWFARKSVVRLRSI